MRLDFFAGFFAVFFFTFRNTPPFATHYRNFARMAQVTS
jgi:hypothetical protein